MKEYETLIRKHISLCFKNDRCMYFDYGISENKPNVVNLYEVYEDEDALAEHKKSAHLAEYLEAAKDLVDGQSEVTEMTLALAEFVSSQQPAGVSRTRANAGRSTRSSR